MFTFIYFKKTNMIWTSSCIISVVMERKHLSVPFSVVSPCILVHSLILCFPTAHLYTEWSSQGEIQSVSAQSAAEVTPDSLETRTTVMTFLSFAVFWILFIFLLENPQSDLWVVRKRKQNILFFFPFKGTWSRWCILKKVLIIWII